MLRVRHKRAYGSLSEAICSERAGSPLDQRLSFGSSCVIEESARLSPAIPAGLRANVEYALPANGRRCKVMLDMGGVILSADPDRFIAARRRSVFVFIRLMRRST